MFCRRMFYFSIFHICLPTVTSILSWPENDIGRTCIYSNGLFNTDRNLLLCGFWDILWAPWDLPFSKTFSMIFWVWVGLFCRFCQYIPRPSVWDTEVGPMCKRRFWSKVDQKQPLNSNSICVGVPRASMWRFVTEVFSGHCRQISDITESQNMVDVYKCPTIVMVVKSNK